MWTEEYGKQVVADLNGASFWYRERSRSWHRVIVLTDGKLLSIKPIDTPESTRASYAFQGISTTCNEQGTQLALDPSDPKFCHVRSSVEYWWMNHNKHIHSTLKQAIERGYLTFEEFFGSIPDYSGGATCPF